MLCIREGKWVLAGLFLPASSGARSRLRPFAGNGRRSFHDPLMITHLVGASDEATSCWDPDMSVAEV